MTKKKIMIVIAAIVVILAAIAISIIVKVHNSNVKIEKTEEAISNIGIAVTLNSEKDISNAENLYNSLTEEEKQKVKNYYTLSNARKSYDKMRFVYDGIASLNPDDMFFSSKATNIYEAYKNLPPAHQLQIANYNELEKYFCKRMSCYKITTKDFCSLHECCDFFCEKGTTLSGNYCEEHECAYKWCTQKKDILSDYCTFHGKKYYR